MVYESDFYTTRRPYSSSRPYVSSYNVTPLHGPFYLYTPTYTNLVRALPVTSIHPHLPYIAHKRLVTITHSPVRIYHRGTYLPLKLHARVRPSIIAAELNRIRYLTRPCTASYLEHYLQSKDYIDFDDETREIRAKTDNLLRKIHTFIPRPVLSDYDETSPERLRSDDYVRRIINAKNTRKEIESLPWYETPEKHRDIGAGHLACVKYAGGRPQSRRRPYYTVSDLVPGDVKSDVKLMSYYMKNRKAAEDASPSSEHRREYNKEAEDAPAPSVTWADEVIHEEEPAVKQQQQEQEVAMEVQQAAAEIECKAEKKKKKEKKAKAEESAENGEPEGEYDENGVKKQPDEDTIKKVQEYIEKKTAEKKMEEERRAWEAAEQKRIAEEKEIARLAILLEEEERRQAEIAEQERLEAERQEVIRRAEEARAEAARLIEDEKLYNEAIAQAIADEQERVIKEMERDEQKKKQQEEEEEKMANLVAGTNGISNEVAVDEAPVEEHSHHDLSDQEIEAKPYDVDNDEDTQIEEDVHEEPEEIEDPFTDGEGAAAPAQADEPVEDEPQVTVTKRKAAGGEQGFDWSDYESSEPAVEEVVVETQAAEVEGEAPAEQPQVFDEAEVSSQADVEEAQVEEAETTEEAQVEETEDAQVEETQETEEAPETTEEVQIEEVQATEEAEDEEAQATEEVEQAEVEEEKSAHASEEEDEEEEE